MLYNITLYRCKREIISKIIYNNIRVLIFIILLCVETVSCTKKRILILLKDPFSLLKLSRYIELITEIMIRSSEICIHTTYREKCRCNRSTTMHQVRRYVCDDSHKSFQSSADLQEKLSILLQMSSRESGIYVLVSFLWHSWRYRFYAFLINIIVELFLHHIA